jgi:RNA polymerase sigma-70 factor, ECF subfamily
VAKTARVDDSTAVRDDAALLQLLRARKPDGLARLYDRYGATVFSVAQHVLHNADAAAVITQDVFLHCWQHSERAPSTDLGAWLVAMAHQRAIEERRSWRDPHYRHAGVASRPPLALDPAEPSPRSPSRATIRAALALLPATTRRVIEYVLWSGLTQQQVAHELELPLATIQHEVRAGMQQLRATLDAQPGLGLSAD